ncbi:uncharacterized protein [Argopecten irradians]|uniref:uncharacterized protein n=1 Tax=Argopecten irradians TaxID=31199 RepID=UPI00371525F4
MPPMLIGKGKTSKSLFGYNTKEASEGTIWSFQDRAWMNNSIWEQWFGEVFLANCGADRPQLLLLDGHGSHETLGLLKMAEEENIHIMALPPHTTHYLQPLDRTVFAPFNKAYNLACSDFMSADPCNMGNKWTFPGLFKVAWEKGVSRENVVSGFKSCWIYPLDISAIPECAYEPSTVTDKPAVPKPAAQPEFETSVYNDANKV